MSILTRKILVAMVLAIFLSITNSYAQNENEKINNLIAQKKDFSKKNKTSKVYKIQLYNGNESEAYKIRQKFYASFPEYSIEIIYKSPEWKTHVGKFKTRLDADRALNIIKKKFAGAIVLEDKI
jgi:hypothetical protein